MINPVRGLLDASAALVALVGVGVLYVVGGDALPQRLALVVFGLSLAGLYTVSTLYHSVPWQRVWKYRMQRLDHAMIYLLVAGSYTPIAVIVLDGGLRWITLAVVWGIAAVGIGQKLLVPRVPAAFTVALTTTQGWLAIFLLVPLAEALPWSALALTLVGGVLYTIGMVFLVTRWPRMWPRVFSYHEAMHVCVIAGSVCHWLMTVRYVAPYADV